MNDAFGAAILLQLTIAALRSELTEQVCKDHPRLILLALAGLDMQAKELMQAMASEACEAGEKPSS